MDEFIIKEYEGLKRRINVEGKPEIKKPKIKPKEDVLNQTRITSEFSAWNYDIGLQTYVDWEQDS